MCILCVWGVGEVAAWREVWGVLQPGILGGLQVLSWLQSCLSCHPEHHLLPPGAVGAEHCQWVPWGNCSIHPPHVLMHKFPHSDPSQHPL